MTDEPVFPMTEQEALEWINGPEQYSADALVDLADAGFRRRFKRLDKSICKLLKDIRVKFPDAQYYTASGGFNLLLGRPHNDHEHPQQELSALGGFAQIGDGDY